MFEVMRSTGAIDVARRGASEPVITGRQEAMEVIDKWLKRSETKTKLETIFDVWIEEDPVGFVKEFLMPLLPKDKGLNGGAMGPQQVVQVITNVPRPHEVTLDAS